jgi:hypothetical protein
MKMNFKKFCLIAIVLPIIAAGCKYEYHGKIMRLEKSWAGYIVPSNEVKDGFVTSETINSNTVYKIDGTDENTLYICTRRGFQFTSDGGTTWKTPEDLVDVVATNIYVDPNNKVYLCTEEGLFKKNDADFNFTKVNVDNTDINATCIFVDEDDTLYVGTKENGLFISTDNGTTWINDLGVKIKRDEENDGPIDKEETKYIPYENEDDTDISDNDPANPRNPDGVIRIYPYYKKNYRLSIYVTDIFVFNGTIYVGSDDGGISFTKKPDSLDSSDAGWDDGTFHFTWETYINPWFRYHADSRAVRDARGGEGYWTIAKNCINDVYVTKDAIFLATREGGISINSFSDNAEQLENSLTAVDELNIYGSRVDVKGNAEYEMNENGNFIPNSAYAQGDDNLKKTLQRFSWGEYTTSGLSVFTPEGKIPPIPPIGQKLPNNTVKSMRFGRIYRDTFEDSSQNDIPYDLVYACTPSGLAVAHYKRDGGGSIALATGDIPWSYYHRDPTTIGEKTSATDVFVIQKANENGYIEDKYVFLATNGQGLMKFEWKRTWYDKIRTDTFGLDSDPEDR